MLNCKKMKACCCSRKMLCCKGAAVSMGSPIDDIELTSYLKMTAAPGDVHMISYLIFASCKDRIAEHSNFSDDPSI